MSCIKAWRLVVEKFKNRLADWKVGSISFEGRLTLVKSVLGSFPLYYFLLFRVPSSVINNLEGIRQDFVLGDWFKMERDNLWVMVIKSVYEENKGLSRCGKEGCESSDRGGWRNIIKVGRNIDKTGWWRKEGGLLRVFRCGNGSGLESLVGEWKLNEEGGFTVKKLICILEDRILDVDNAGEDTIWLKLVPKKVPRVLVTCRSQQLEVEGDKNKNVPLYYYITDNIKIQFGREEFCLVIGLMFGVENLADYNDGELPIPFRRRVFPSSLDGEHITGVKGKRRIPDWLLRLTNDRVGKYVCHKIDTRRDRGSIKLNSIDNLRNKKEILKNKKEILRKLEKEADHQETYEKVHKFMEDMNIDPGGPLSFQKHLNNNSFFNIGTPTNWQTPMSSQPGSSNCQSPIPSHMGNPILQPPIGRHHDVTGLFDQNILNPKRRERRPSIYKQSPYMEQPHSTVLPKKRGNKTKNNVKKSNLSSLNLGNALDDDNEGGDDVMFLGAKFTGWLSGEHMNSWMELLIETDQHGIGTLDGSTRPYPTWNDVNWVFMPIHVGGNHWVTGEIDLPNSHVYVFVLKECICDNPNFLFISNSHDAIALAVENEFPLAFHVPDAYKKLCEAGPQRWSRVHFPLARYNYMTWNSVESVNVRSVIYRKESVLKVSSSSIRSSNVIALDSPYLLVLITGTSQSRQHVDTSLIHLESHKLPTAELFDVDSGRISIHHYEY
uniref:Reverse transcriptase domain, reverse transcriptase zinc-binding domain protein n=1 Tax=Tanacetum cinerariifolium TaxID=118510 RepID=A0A6L2JYM9_TANCI|nr:reverse transcriptase domain, reverse transcriptase zinc-binding domain protein [Tanacetum cinerariifolium]